MRFGRRMHFVVVEAVPATAPLAEIGIVARIHRAFVHDDREQIVQIGSATINQERERERKGDELANAAFP